MFVAEGTQPVRRNREGEHQSRDPRVLSEKKEGYYFRKGGSSQARKKKAKGQRVCCHF